MHTLIKTAFLVTSLATGLAGAADLTIQVDDVKAATGSVLVAVFNSEGTFLKAAAKSGGAPATLNGTTVVIGDLPEGDYAFAVYHDANANGKMDRNLLGIPIEDYGFSYCSTTEGIAFTLKALPNDGGAALWRGYYYLGYDTEPNCPDPS